MVSIIHTREDVNIGDIIYQDLHSNDGLKLKHGFRSRRKYFVIVGKKSNNEAIGVCLINSNLDYYSSDMYRAKYQYILKKELYSDFLIKDSRLDCSELFEIPVKKSIAMKAIIVGHLVEEDLKQVIYLLKTCDYINEKRRKVFHIGEII